MTPHEEMTQNLWMVNGNGMPDAIWDVQADPVFMMFMYRQAHHRNLTTSTFANTYARNRAKVPFTTSFKLLEVEKNYDGIRQLRPTKLIKSNTGMGDVGRTFMQFTGISSVVSRGTNQWLWKRH